jgi:hypothetical protein
MTLKQFTILCEFGFKLMIKFMITINQSFLSFFLYFCFTEMDEKIRT